MDNFNYMERRFQFPWLSDKYSSLPREIRDHLHELRVHNANLYKRIQEVENLIRQLKEEFEVKFHY